LQGRLGPNHRSSHLVTQDHGLAQPDVPEAAAVEIVKIGPADPTNLDGNLDLAADRLLFFALLDPEILRGMDDDGSHGRLYPVLQP